MLGLSEKKLINLPLPTNRQQRIIDHVPLYMVIRIDESIKLEKSWFKNNKKASKNIKRSKKNFLI